MNDLLEDNFNITKPLTYYMWLLSQGSSSMIRCSITCGGIRYGGVSVCDKKKRSQIFNQREDYINYYRTQRKKKTGEDSISSIRFKILETSLKLIHLRFLLNIFPNTIQL